MPPKDFTNQSPCPRSQLWWKEIGQTLPKSNKLHQLLSHKLTQIHVKLHLEIRQWNSEVVARLTFLRGFMISIMSMNSARSISGTWIEITTLWGARSSPCLWRIVLVRKVTTTIRSPQLACRKHLTLLKMELKSKWIWELWLNTWSMSFYTERKM